MFLKFSLGEYPPNSFTDYLLNNYLNKGILILTLTCLYHYNHGAIRCSICVKMNLYIYKGIHLSLYPKHHSTGKLLEYLFSKRLPCWDIPRSYQNLPEITTNAQKLPYNYQKLPKTSRNAWILMIDH